MGFLIAAFLLLFLLLLVSMPLILEARVRVGLRGASLRAKLYLFGLIPIPVRLTLHLFSDPYFTLRIGSKTVPLFGRRRSGGEIGLLKGVRLLRLETAATVGIEGDPARSVIAAGSVAAALSLLTARFAESGTAKARFARSPMLRIAIRANALLFPLEMLCGFLTERRIARAKAANNRRNLKEKRNGYASC